MVGGFSIKKFLPRTLFGRSLLILVTPVILIQVISSFIFFDRHWGKMTTRLAFAVAGEIALLSDVYKGEDTSGERTQLINLAEEYLDLAVEFEAGSKIPDAQKSSIVEIWEAVVAEKLEHELRLQINDPFVVHTNFREKTIDVFVEQQEGVLKVSLPQGRLFSSSGYIFLLWMIGTSMLLLVIAILFMRNQIRPIRKLAVAAERFGKGRETPSFKPEGAFEVRQAANAFIEMSRRIQRQISQRTDMLAGVSHDLRTPLTRMKLQIEMLPAGPDVEDLKSDIQEMERMIQAYLDFVRGDGDEQFASVDLHALFEKLTASMKRQGFEISTNIGEGLRLFVRPMAFERALGNVLSNAGKYAKHVWVSAAVDGKKIQIQIEDNGPGIPPDLYEEVFKPFVRVDTSRNIDTGGVGLGLPISMDIIHAHGGKITLDKSEAHGGLRVVIRMPI